MLKASPFFVKYLQEVLTMECKKEFKEMTFEEQVADYASTLEDEGESDLCDVYRSWCVLLEELVFMPKFSFGDDFFKADQWSYEAVKSVFCKKSGMPQESALVNLFYIFYLGWIHGSDHDRGLYRYKTVEKEAQ